MESHPNPAPAAKRPRRRRELLFAAAFLLVTALLFGLSVWVRSATNLIFLGLCLLGLPLLWDGGAMLYTHGGLLSGTRMLLWLGDSVGNLLLPLAVVAAYSVAVSVLAARHHARGL